MIRNTSASPRICLICRGAILLQLYTPINGTTSDIRASRMRDSSATSDCPSPRGICCPTGRRRRRSVCAELILFHPLGIHQSSGGAIVARHRHLALALGYGRSRGRIHLTVCNRSPRNHILRIESAIRVRSTRRGWRSMKLGRGIGRFNGYSKRYDSGLSWDPTLPKFIGQNCIFRIDQHLPLGEPSWMPPSVLFRLRFKHTRTKRTMIINKTPPTMPPTIAPTGVCVFFSDWVVEPVAKEPCPVGVLEDTEYTDEYTDE